MHYKIWIQKLKVGGYLVGIEGAPPEETVHASSTYDLGNVIRDIVAPIVPMAPGADLDLDVKPGSEPL